MLFRSTITDFSGFTFTETVAGNSSSYDFRLSSLTECKVTYQQPLVADGGFIVTVTSTGTNPC